jgi:hypothetical protein
MPVFPALQMVGMSNNKRINMHFFMGVIASVQSFRTGIPLCSLVSHFHAIPSGHMQYSTAMTTGMFGNRKLISWAAAFIPKVTFGALPWLL